VVRKKRKGSRIAEDKNRLDSRRKNSDGRLLGGGSRRFRARQKLRGGRGEEKIRKGMKLRKYAEYVRGSTKCRPRGGGTHLGKKRFSTMMKGKASPTSTSLKKKGREKARTGNTKPPEEGPKNLRVRMIDMVFWRGGLLEKKGIIVVTQVEKEKS